MGFALLRTQAALTAFKARFNIPQDVIIEFCPEGDIKNDRLPKVVFFPLMSILEGRVRFPMDPILLRTLGFYSLCPDQCLPNFCRVVNSVIRLKTYTA